VPSEEESISLLMHKALFEYEVRIAEVRLDFIFLDRGAFLQSLGFIEVLACVTDFLINLRCNGVLILEI
jgi:hypothetical protein